MKNKTKQKQTNKTKQKQENSCHGCLELQIMLFSAGYGLFYEKLNKHPAREYNILIPRLSLLLNTNAKEITYYTNKEVVM